MVTVPEQTLPGELAEMQVSIINLGTTATNTKETELEVYRGNNETPIKTSPLPAVSPFQTAIVKLADRLNYF